MADLSLHDDIRKRATLAEQPQSQGLKPYTMAIVDHIWEKTTVTDKGICRNMMGRYIKAEQALDIAALHAKVTWESGSLINDEDWRKFRIICDKLNENENRIARRIQRGIEKRKTQI